MQNFLKDITHITVNVGFIVGNAATCICISTMSLGDKWSVARSALSKNYVKISEKSP